MGATKVIQMAKQALESLFRIERLLVEIRDYLGRREMADRTRDIARAKEPVA
jgi:hypothetical protein